MELSKEGLEYAAMSMFCMDIVLGLFALRVGRKEALRFLAAMWFFMICAVATLYVATRI